MRAAAYNDLWIFARNFRSIRSPTFPSVRRGIAAPSSLVYVHERQGWEYKVITRRAGELPMPEHELNALGESGWELAGVVAAQGTAQFYCKRVRR